MLRFTIRDVLWLTVVVGLSLCLWHERSSLARFVQASRAENRRLQEQHDADKIRIQEQHEALESLTLENANLEREAASLALRIPRKFPWFSEAEPGVYYLYPFPAPGGVRRHEMPDADVVRRLIAFHQDRFRSVTINPNRGRFDRFLIEGTVDSQADLDFLREELNWRFGKEGGRYIISMTVAP
jgi:hypothetical protein